MQRDADLTHATLAIFFLVVLAAATFWVLSPFLTSILWAVIVCVATWPILLRLEAQFGGRRKLAVAVMIAMILLVIFVPVVLALTTIISNAQNITAVIRSFQTIALPPPPDWLVAIPFGGNRLAETWTRFRALDAEQRTAELTPYVQTAIGWFAAQAGGIGATLLQFLLTAIISAIVLANGEYVRDWILRFAERLAGRYGYDAAVLAGQTIRGVVLGVVVTAVVQAAIAGVGLYIAGVPAAALLAASILFLCLAQIGPLPVMIPAAIWLFWSEQAVLGSVLVVFAIISGTIDQFLRPVLIRRGANLPLVLIFAGVIGGLIAFGIIGLFIGPVVLSVTFTLLATWVAQGPPHDAAVNQERSTSSS